MAYTGEPTITTTYAGEFAGKYISAALLSAPTIENGGVTVLPNIKYKEVLQVVNTADLLTDATCDFTDTADVDLTEKILEVEDFQVNSEICKAQFHNTWQSQEMGFSAFDELPKSFSDYILGYYAAKVAAKVETNLWEGVNANPGEFDGLVTLALADATVNDVTAVAGGVDAANVIDEMGRIVDAIPTTVYGSEDLKLYVSSNMARAYIRALGGFGAQGLGGNGTDGKGTQWYSNGSVSFDGIPVFVANGLNDNTAMAAQTSNLYFGCSLLADTQEVRLIDMSPIDGSQNCRIIMRMSMGAQIGIGADVVLYHP